MRGPNMQTPAPGPAPLTALGVFVAAGWLYRVDGGPWRFSLKQVSVGDGSWLEQVPVFIRNRDIT